MSCSLPRLRRASSQRKSRPPDRVWPEERICAPLATFVKDKTRGPLARKGPQMVSMDPAIERGATRVIRGESRPRSAPPRIRLPFDGFGALRALLLPLLLLALWQLAVNREFYSRGQLPPPLDVLAAGQELQSIGLLVPNVLASVQRVAIGWGIGAAV